ncbi:MAG: class I SAM-dependent methyltransferase [Pontixanthobacter sp.]
MTTVQNWADRVGKSWAEEWQRTDRSFGGLTDELLATVRQQRFQCVLDVGCGAGEVSLAIARDQGGAEIRGLDISPELITVARSRSANLSNIAFEHGNAADWQDDDFRPDLIVSRHGTMFFEDPSVAFAHLRNISKDNARLVFSCFRGSDENPWASRISELLPTSVQQDTPDIHDEPPPGPFAFADQSYVTRILQAAGWGEIAFTPVDYAYIAGTGPKPVDDAMAFFHRIGPAAKTYATLPHADRVLFDGKLRHLLERHEDKGLVAFRASAWIVGARAGED